MSGESTALRFVHAAVAAEFHKTDLLKPFLWNLAIVTMGISIGVEGHTDGRRKVFAKIEQKSWA